MENIKDTLLQYINNENIKYYVIKETNDNIDIAICAENEVTFNNIIETLFKSYKRTVDITNNTITVYYSVNNIELTCNITYSPNIEYAKFYYNLIAEDETKNLMIRTILNHCTNSLFNDIDNTKYKVIYKILNKGLYKVLTEKDNIKNICYAFITSNPNEILSIAFNEPSINIVDTVNTIWDAFHNQFKYPEKIEAIEASILINSYINENAETLNSSNFNVSDNIINYVNGYINHYIINHNNVNKLKNDIINNKRKFK